MFCKKCGTNIPDTAVFCPKCGIKLDGKAIKPADFDKEDRKGPVAGKCKEETKPTKAARQTGQKKRSFLLKLFLIILLLVLLAAGVTGLLASFGVVNIPAVNDALAFVGLQKAREASVDENGIDIMGDIIDENDIPSLYKQDPIDADAYYETNATVISQIPAQDSSDAHTESDTRQNFIDRGFIDLTITTQYSMEGQYQDPSEVSDASSAKHPMYEAYYMTAEGHVWTLIEINGAIMANPVSYNLQSSRNAQLLLSESNTVTSYDSYTNKFYESIPNETELIVKTVSKIDANTLESLTFEAINQLP